MTKIGILGAGAIGSYYGALLAQDPNNQVHLVSSQHTSPLTIRSAVHDDISIDKIQWHSREDLPKDCEITIVASKTTANPDLIEPLRKMVRDHDTVIVIMQNGYGNEQFFAQHFPQNPIVGGICFVAVKREADHVRHAANKLLILGSYQENKDHVEHFAQLFQEDQVDVRVSFDIQSDRWRKLLWNIPFNCLSTLQEKAPRDLVREPETREYILAIMTEIINATAKMDTPLTQQDINKLIVFTEKMDRTEPSMLIDYRAGQQPETEYLLENPIAYAASKGIAMPLTTDLLAKVSEKFTSSAHT